MHNRPIIYIKYLIYTFERSNRCLLEIQTMGVVFKRPHKFIYAYKMLTALMRHGLVNYCFARQMVRGTHENVF